MEFTTLEELLADDSFLRYAKGRATPEEKLQWDGWLERSEANRELFQQASELIRFMSGSVTRLPDPRQELSKLESFIQPGRSTKTKVGFRHVKRKRGGYAWLTAAIITIVAVTLAFVIDQYAVAEEVEPQITTVQSTSEFQTSYGEKATFQLTDGSRIILNANSHLQYTYTGTSAGNRDIDIYLNGEAWFDVMPVNPDGGDSRKIRVHTHDGLVEVLGTTFAIYSNEAGTRAVLEKGNIAITRFADEQAGIDTKPVIMQPGQMATLSPGGSGIELINVNPDIYTSWIRDVWVFDQTPVADVAERIKDVFGVNVTVMSDELLHERLSGSISSENLHLIKEGISEALQRPVSIINNTIIIGG